MLSSCSNRTSEQIDGSVVGSSYNNLNQFTGQSGGGKMVFSGTLSEPAVVTVAGQPATSSYYSTNFYGIAPVTIGTNTVAVVAHDVNGNYGTNNYQVVVPPASSSSSYDLNGNLLTNGARTFQWDAKNQMTAIIYNTGPNAGNHTELTYNGAGERVKIVEATGTTVGSGTVTSTKQFVWAGGLAEEHDASNTVTKRFFAQGEQIAGTNYYYTTDHLGSVREMIAGDGKTIATRYSYDPYGRRTKVSGTIDSDFGFTGHYWHANSGLYLAPYRAYDPNLGRWVSRDPSGEGSGINLYSYCDGNPANAVDTTGDISVWVVAAGGGAGAASEAIKGIHQHKTTAQVIVMSIHGAAGGIVGTTVTSVMLDAHINAATSVETGVILDQGWVSYAETGTLPTSQELVSDIVAADTATGLSKFLPDEDELAQEALADGLDLLKDLFSQPDAENKPTNNNSSRSCLDSLNQTPVVPSQLLPDGRRP